MHKATMKKLLKEQGITEDITNKSKDELLAMLGKAQSINEEVVLDTVLDNVELSNESTEKQEAENSVPDYLSPEWSDFVLSQFNKDELSDGAPNVHGLRRVAQLLLGPIVSTKVISLFPATDPTSYGRASCIYEIVFEWSDGLLRTFQDVAGAYPGNTDKEYAKYPEAMSATRAEARCLRKALRIKGPASEEVCLTPTTEDLGITVMTNVISGTQIAFIKKRCQDYTISVSKLIKKIIGEENALENLTREQAQQICQFINEIQTNRSDITEDLKETL